MSDGKEVKLRTNPPRNCQYLTWCNDCEEAVPHEEGSCAGCASLDLVYFVKESDHDRIVAELRAEIPTALKRVFDRQVGFMVSANAFRVLAEEIQKYDPAFVLPNSFARRKFVADRNDEIQKLKAEVERLRKSESIQIGDLIFTRGDTYDGKLWLSRPSGEGMAVGTTEPELIALLETFYKRHL